MPTRPPRACALEWRSIRRTGRRLRDITRSKLRVGENFVPSPLAPFGQECRPSDATDDSMVSPRISASAPVADPAGSSLVVHDDGETGLRELYTNPL